MDKNDILAKSRNSRRDEGMEYVENKGRKIGFVIFSFIFVFIIVFNLFFSKGNNSVFYAASSMFWVFISAEAFQKFKFTQKKVDLVTGIAGAIATVCWLANFIIITLK
ncbi:hypothetical protein GNF80_14210 [Clostridium perfringens]|nr:hypothetical protein [Clostridium perfringens]